MQTPPKEGRIYQGLSAEGRRAERRQKLLDAAVAVYGTQGYHTATVSAVCEAAGLTKRYFYEEFDSQESLLCATYAGIMAEVRDNLQAVWDLEKPFSQRLLETATAFFGFMQQQPAKARIMLLESEGVSERVNRVGDDEIRASTEMLRRYLFTAPLPAAAQPDLLALGILGAIYQLAKMWITHPGVASVEEMAVQVQLLCLGAVSVNEG